MLTATAPTECFTKNDATTTTDHGKKLCPWYILPNCALQLRDTIAFGHVVVVEYKVLHMHVCVRLKALSTHSYIT